METIIKTESLTKIYNPLSLNPKLALDQVSLDVKEGEFIAIMGKSGSGKTTLLNILSTIDDLTKVNFLFMVKIFMKCLKLKELIFEKKILVLFFKTLIY